MKRIAFITTKIIILTFLFNTPFLAFAETNDYCVHTAEYGYHAYASKASYIRGEVIHFCLSDDTRNPLFIGPDEHPWVIKDMAGNTVYTPESTPPDTQPPLAYEFFDEWDGRDEQGNLVSPGNYRIVFPTYPTEPETTIAIVGMKQVVSPLAR